MSAEQGGAPQRKRMIIYASAGLIALILVVWGVISYNRIQDNAKSRQKAQQLIDSLNDAGLQAPSKDIIVNTLGSDGGMVCENADSPHALARFKNMIANGAAGPGIRPIIGDADAVKAETLVIATYCPDKLGKFTKTVDGLRLEDTRR